MEENRSNKVDIIQLLPDNIANQIAAGEVIQRPASAVKELLENAIDAGATEIKLYVQDAGKALVQVVDNGKGMSETDARMSFERHATSKIKKIEDLFTISTMGFRGEALASIAAVAQVELRTRRAEDELGTYLEIENSTVGKQEPCQAPAGTSISMKNLFFNVPARRNFLKSNSAEMRHIVDEFIHVAMAFPEIFFSLSSNGQEMFHLEAGSLKQRVVQLLGNQLNAKLVNVEDHTDYLTIKGFVGKPDTARKTRGDQYFFVNNRFIKSAYLNHAVVNAFDQLLPADSYPLYVLFIELDPSEVDINVHPTKQEVKFEDERIIYAFVCAAVKHALAQFSVAPSLDFSLNSDIQQLDAVNQPFTELQKKEASESGLFKTFTQHNQAHFIEGSPKKDLRNWQDFYRSPLKPAGAESFPAFPVTPGASTDETGTDVTDDHTLLKEEGQRAVILPDALYVQVKDTYILVPTTDGFLLVHQQLAHERVLYEKFASMVHRSGNATQKLLFPSSLQLAPADMFLLEDLQPELRALGYEVDKKDDSHFVVNGIPADMMEGNETHVLELLIEQFKHFSSDIKFSKREKLIRCLARQQAIKAGRSLTQPEMKLLVDSLWKCTVPNLTPNGNSPTYIAFSENYLDSLFGRK